MPGKLKSKDLWHLSLTILVFSTFVLILFRTAADPDLWGHLRFGLDTLQAGQIIQTDVYSFATAGQRWINHEWLAEVLFALAWNVKGELGLILLKALIGFLTIGFLYGHLTRRNLSAIQKLPLLLIGALPLMPFLFHIRPQMFTYLFFTLTLIFVYQAEHGAYHWLYAAPGVLALWVNTHGGVLAGVGMLCLWAGLHVLRNRQAWKRVSFPVIMSLAATLINPYGSGLLAFLLRTATVPRPEIEDWQPLALTSTLGFMYLLALGISVAGIALSAQKRNPVMLSLFGIAALLPWLAMRHLPLFSIAAIIFVGEHVGSAWQTIRPSRREERRIPVWLAGLPLLASALLWVGGARLDLHRIHILGENRLPAAAVRLLKQSGVAGNLATEFDWGEYIIWHLGPSLKVSIDGRRETVYPPQAYRQNLHFMFGVGEWEALLSEYAVDLALVTKQAPNDHLLRLKPDWELVFEDEQSVLYVKQGAALAQVVRKAAREFTGGEEDAYFP